MDTSVFFEMERSFETESPRCATRPYSVTVGVRQLGGKVVFEVVTETGSKPLGISCQRQTAPVMNCR